jgi:hypothetical protein
MAKRIRGTGRPGQRPAIRRPASRPSTPGSAVIRPTRSLTRDEEARAAELEARILADERAAQEAARKEQARSTAPVVRREAEPLSVRAAHEYAYVRRDVFRIARIAALLLAILAVLYVLINVMRVIQV